MCLVDPGDRHRSERGPGSSGNDYPTDAPVGEGGIALTGRETGRPGRWRIARHRTRARRLEGRPLATGTRRLNAERAVAPAAPPICAGEIATITGSTAGEAIIGTAGRDVIVAEGGNDEVRGRGRDDLMCGGGGKGLDVRRGRPGPIVRGAGNDRLDGGKGQNRLIGGLGRDTCVRRREQKTRH